jgi:hypothetical protein
MILVSETPRSETAHLSAMIVAIAESGDRQAFSDLFSHFAPRVKSYLLRLGAASWASSSACSEAAPPPRPGSSPSPATCASTPCGASAGP